MKSRGFTLIELLISVVAIGIVLVIIAGIVQGNFSSGSNSISFGVNGVVETRCAGGYKFMMGHDGSARQVMNEFGHGVKCN